MLNVRSCKLQEVDVSKMLAVTYSLKCVKLQCLVMGGNCVGKEVKHLVVCCGALNAPNAYISTSSKNESELQHLIYTRSVVNPIKGKVFTNSKHYAHMKGKKLVYFHGKESLLTAVAFGYLKLLIEIDKYATASLDIFIKLYLH